VLLVVLLVAASAHWQTEVAGVIWSERIEIAAGDAHRGPWRMNRSEFHYVDDPTVAMDEEGSVGVVWADQTRRDLFFQRYSPDGEKRFMNPVGVSRSPDVFSWLPRLVLNDGDSGDVYVLWQEIVFSGGTHGGEIFFARSSDGGETFHPPVNLSNSLAGDGKGRLTRRYWHNGSLDLALGAGGVLHVAWTEYEGTLLVSRSADGGNSFSTPMRIAGGTTGTPDQPTSTFPGRLTVANRSSRHESLSRRMGTPTPQRSRLTRQERCTSASRRARLGFSSDTISVTCVRKMAGEPSRVCGQFPTPTPNALRVGAFRR
jgi:hypothetical protein